MSWTFTDSTPPELTCSFKPSCLFCGEKMTLENTTMYKVQMTGQNDPDPQGRAIDIIVKCHACGYIEAFGVALSQDEAAKIHG